MIAKRVASYLLTGALLFWSASLLLVLPIGYKFWLALLSTVIFAGLFVANIIRDWHNPKDSNQL